MEDHASSSAHDARNNQRRVRNRAGAPHYAMPGQKPPVFAISDRYGPSIDPAFGPLARDLFLFDLALLRRVEIAERKHTSSTDEVRKTRAVRRVEEFVEIRQQWEEIDLCHNQFSQSYMLNKSFIPIWVEGLRIVKQALGNDTKSGNSIKQRTDYMKILAKYERLACRLQDRLVDTARQGILTNDVLLPIQERWIRLDDLLDDYYDTYNDDRDEDTPLLGRIAPPWEKVGRLIRESEPNVRTGKESIQNQLASAVPDASHSVTTVGIFGSKENSAFILWLALLISIVASLASFARGCELSPHNQGTTHDADFWFLIQATVMQLLGLVASALLEWRSAVLPRWRWALPTVVAAACSITAIPLYLAVPTEWSAFLSLTAGATQSFMVLQHFLSSSKDNVVLGS